MIRQRVASGTTWEAQVGYARAVRIGHHVCVAGTLAVDSAGNVIGIGDPHAQTVAAIRQVEAALNAAGCTLSEVIRTRMYVTDIDAWPEIGRAHRQYFGVIRPCATMVEVTRLAHPDAMVELEVDAVLDRDE